MKFHDHHPLNDFIYFILAVFFIVRFDHPVYIGISYLVMFSFSICLNGLKGLIMNLLLIPGIVMYDIAYSFFNHFGTTAVFENDGANQITLEVILFGATIGLRAAALIMCFACMSKIISTDKIIYIIGKISPNAAILTSLLIKTVPETKNMWKETTLSLKGIGMDGQRKNILSIIITYFFDNIFQRRHSMKSRGYSLKGRTAFLYYRFGSRERIITVIMCICTVATAMAAALDQTNIHFDPHIVSSRITWTSIAFFVFYFVLIAMPLLLQIFNTVSVRRSRYRS